MKALLMLALLGCVLAASCAEEAEAPTGTATPVATGTISATTTVVPAATATSTAGAPPGYETSCAAGYPWGRQVARGFVCIEAPNSGTTVMRGQTVTVRGYAGGSFENNVVIELLDADGHTPVREPLTYAAPDIGMPGVWEARVPVPVGIPLGPARMSAHFTSPRDGGVVALASVEMRVQ